MLFFARRNPNESQLQRKIDQLEEHLLLVSRQLWHLQHSARQPFTVPIPTRPKCPPKPLRLYAERRISRVLVARHSRQTVALDQAGVPIQEYCGDFRRVGGKIVAAYPGINWQEVEDSQIARLNFSR